MINHIVRTLNPDIITINATEFTRSIKIPTPLGTHSDAIECIAVLIAYPSFNTAIDNIFGYYFNKYSARLTKDRLKLRILDDLKKIHPLLYSKFAKRIICKFEKMYKAESKEAQIRLSQIYAQAYAEPANIVPA